MNLLTYTQNFANALKTGAIYQAPLNPQEAIFHRAIGHFIDKAIASSAGLELSGDLLVELLKSQQTASEMQKKIEELQKPVEQEPEEKTETEQAPTEQAE